MSRSQDNEEERGPAYLILEILAVFDADSGLTTEALSLDSWHDSYVGALSCR